MDLIRTLSQWRATARRLEHREIGRPDLADQVRWAFPADQTIHPDTPVTVSLIPEDAAVIETRTPLDAWWMPKSSGWSLPRRAPARTAGETAVDTAEAIIREHQHRPDT